MWRSASCSINTCRRASPGRSRNSAAAAPARTATDGWLASGREWQVDRECGSDAGRAEHLDRATVRLGNMAHDGEPESGATGRARSRVVDSIEPFEDAVEILGRNTDPCVCDGQLRISAGTVRRRMHLPALWRVPNGVLEQILNEMTKITLGSKDQERAVHFG